MMDTNVQIQAVEQQEKTLVFDEFNHEIAWLLGNRLVEKAKQENVAVTIDISYHHRQIFHYSFAGTAQTNNRWAERKTNVVYHFAKSSYLIGLQLRSLNTTLYDRYGLKPDEYVACGGSFPITVHGSGVVGAIAVSGLTQEEDHALVTDVIREYLGSL